MIFEEFLVNELNLIVDVKDNIFPLSAPEGTKAPYIIYTSSEGLEDKTLSGYLSSKLISLDIDVYHNSYSDMKVLTKNVLSKFKGFINRNFDIYRIENVTYEDPIELYENEVYLFRSSINFKIKIG